MRSSNRVWNFWEIFIALNKNKNITWSLYFNAWPLAHSGVPRNATIVLGGLRYPSPSCKCGMKFWKKWQKINKQWTFAPCPGQTKHTQTRHRDVWKILWGIRINDYNAKITGSFPCFQVSRLCVKFPGGACRRGLSMLQVPREEHDL